MILRGKGRPAAYKKIDGTRVASVTTITAGWKPGVEALLVWANRLGLEGKDHREERDKAAGAGTLAHSLVENAIHGNDPWSDINIEGADQEMLTRAQKGFEAYEAWEKMLGIQYVATELPLVSEAYGYGGTIDAIATDHEGIIGLYDWKTGGSIRADMILQVAAYSKLWNEHYPDREIGKIYILRFGRDHGDFHFHSWPESIIEMAWQGFLHLLAMYGIDKQLTKVAK
jgi:hypothetical protein